MCFVFEHHKPAFCCARIVGSKRLTIFICRVMYVYINRAGIVFFRNFHIFKLSVLFKILHSDYCHIHEADRLICTAGIHFCTHSLVIFKGFFEERCIRTVFNFDILKFCKEGCVAAVVRPVSVENADFCFNRVAAFSLKIILKEYDISMIHSKAHLVAVCFNLFVIHLDKAFYNRNVGWLFNMHL